MEVERKRGIKDESGQMFSFPSTALWARIEKNTLDSHPIIHRLTSEGVSEVSAANE